MIDKISFKNYKIFKDKQTIELKPITIIIGKNNSGKSAVAKLPTLIEGSLLSDSADAIMVENDGVELGAELKDLVYGKSLRELELDLIDKSQEVENCLSVNILVSQEGSRQTSKIVKWKLNDEIDLEDINGQNLYVNIKTNQEGLYNFNGFNPTAVEYREDITKINILEHNLKLKTDFIGPIRVKPPRDFRQPSAIKTDKFGTEGENAYTYLIEDALTTERKLISNISEWYRKNFEGWEIKVNQDKAPIYQIEVYRNNLKQNILDTGIGMSQVLPIITRAFKRCEEETLIIIEEPETHLHPAAHGNLAELFATTLQQGNKKYLIETHSLNFVLRLRRLVAEGKLDKSDLGFYYVDFLEDKNYSIIHEITVDELGRVSDWPEGIFNETLSETVGIRSAQLHKENNDN